MLHSAAKKQNKTKKEIPSCPFPMYTPFLGKNLYSDIYYHRLILPILGLHINGNHLVCTLLCLSSFIQHYVCEIYSYTGL